MNRDAYIIEEAAKILKQSEDIDHPMLRVAFWVAGRCEACGNVVYELSNCFRCGHPVTNRSELLASQGASSE